MRHRADNDLLSYDPPLLDVKFRVSCMMLLDLSSERLLLGWKKKKLTPIGTVTQKGSQGRKKDLPRTKNTTNIFSFFFFATRTN